MRCASSSGCPKSIHERNSCTCCCATKDHWEPYACSRTQITYASGPDYHLHHDTAKHSYSCVVRESTGERNGILVSSVKRVGSVCIWVMDIHMYGIDLVERHLPECICTQHTGPTSGFMVWGGGISYNLQSHLVFLEGKQCPLQCTGC